MIHADYDDLKLCRVCGDRYAIGGSDLCHVCEMQERIDNSDYDPFRCPFCGSSLIDCDMGDSELMRCRKCGKKW